MPYVQEVVAHFYIVTNGINWDNLFPGHKGFVNMNHNITSELHEMLYSSRNSAWKLDQSHAAVVRMKAPGSTVMYLLDFLFLNTHTYSTPTGTILKIWNIGDINYSKALKNTKIL